MAFTYSYILHIQICYVKYNFHYNFTCLLKRWRGREGETDGGGAGEIDVGGRRRVGKAEKKKEIGGRVRKGREREEEGEQERKI